MIRIDGDNFANRVGKSGSTGPPRTWIGIASSIFTAKSRLAHRLHFINPTQSEPSTRMSHGKNLNVVAVHRLLRSDDWRRSIARLVDATGRRADANDVNQQQRRVRRRGAPSEWRAESLAVDIHASLIGDLAMRRAAANATGAASRLARPGHHREWSSLASRRGVEASTCRRMSSVDRRIARARGARLPSCR